MKRIKYWIKLLVHPYLMLEKLAFHFGTDKQYLRIWYLNRMGYWMNFDNPKTFNEKLQWLKLYNRKPKYTTMVDKYAVKKYVADIIGEQYIIPTLGVWDKFDDIDFDTLPDQFVLKCTHDSGGLVICKDKSKLDKKAAKAKIEKSLATDFWKLGREWPYKNVPRRIIVEKFMAPEKSNAPKDLPDYKFFCFNGEPKYCQVIRDRNTKETIDFYDMDWHHQEFVGLNPLARNGRTPVTRPLNLDEMKDICRKLADGTPFVRVDLYVIDDKKYFGELTFYPASGIGIFTPEKWAGKLGELLTLPNPTGGGKYMIINGIINELKTEYEDLKDYKFFCFNGMPRLIQVDFGRFTNHRRNIYDLDWNLINLEIEYPSDHSVTIEKPLSFSQMIHASTELSKGMPVCRVDMYEVKGRMYFGEITLYHGSGQENFTPKEWNLKLGQMINLENVK